MAIISHQSTIEVIFQYRLTIHTWHGMFRYIYVACVLPQHHGNNGSISHQLVSKIIFSKPYIDVSPPYSCPTLGWLPVCTEQWLWPDILKVCGTTYDTHCEVIAALQIQGYGRCMYLTRRSWHHDLSGITAGQGNWNRATNEVDFQSQNTYMVVSTQTRCNLDVI